MTRDELLAEINTELEITHWEGWHEGARALRAVVELHRESVEHKDIPAGICIEDGEQYPCPTIQAIEKELK